MINSIKLDGKLIPNNELRVLFKPSEKYMFFGVDWTSLEGSITGQFSINIYMRANKGDEWYPLNTGSALPRILYTGVSGTSGASLSTLLTTDYNERQILQGFQYKLVFSCDENDDKLIDYNFDVFYSSSLVYPTSKDVGGGK